jgi:beta-N-acetylhexosaminidase
VEERERPPKRVVTWVERTKGKGKRKKVRLVPRPPERVIVGTRLDLVGPGGGQAVGPVVVATGTPYVLGSTAAPVRLATYGSSAGAMDALVAVLQGRQRAPGTLPVPVTGAPRRGC